MKQTISKCIHVNNKSNKIVPRISIVDNVWSIQRNFYSFTIGLRTIIVILLFIHLYKNDVDTHTSWKDKVIGH